MLVLVLVVFASGCPSDLFDSGCGEIRYRCANNTMQLCNADGDWELYRNCGSVGQVCTTIPSRCGGYSGPCCD